MKTILYPQREEWEALLKRPEVEVEAVRETVNQVLARVRAEGDRAVLDYEAQFDGVALESLAVTEAELDEAEESVSISLKAAILLAQQNIRKFHAAQRFEGERIETLPGVVCWQRAVPIERVGLYIPGGTAPLFSTVLMLAIPAQLAGCRDIILCTPPDKQGKIHPAILYAARVAGVHRIFKAGGIQAIGAIGL